MVLRRGDAFKNTRKLEANWEGPYKVTQTLRGGAYKLQYGGVADSSPLECVQPGKVLRLIEGLHPP